MGTLPFPAYCRSIRGRVGWLQRTAPDLDGVDHPGQALSYRLNSKASPENAPSIAP